MLKISNLPVWKNKINLIQTILQLIHTTIKPSTTVYKGVARERERRKREKKKEKKKKNAFVTY